MTYCQVSKRLASKIAVKGMLRTNLHWAFEVELCASAESSIRTGYGSVKERVRSTEKAVVK